MTVKPLTEIVRELNSCKTPKAQFPVSVAMSQHNHS